MLRATLLSLLLLSSALADEVKWAASYDDGLKAAKEAGKPLLIDFFKVWCGWCKKLDAETFPDEKVVKALNEGFICVLVDAEKGAAPDLPKKSKIPECPVVLFLDGEGDPLYRFNGFLPPAQFLDELKKPVEVAKKFAALKESLAKAPDDPKLNYDFGVALAQRGRKDEAHTAFEKVQKPDPDDKAGFGDDIALAHVEEQFLEGAFADAEESLKALMEKYKAGDQMPRAYLYLGFAQSRQNRSDQAVATWKAGSEKYPNAPEIKQALELIKKAEAGKKDEPK